MLVKNDRENFVRGVMGPLQLFDRNVSSQAIVAKVNLLDALDCRAALSSIIRLHLVQEMGRQPSGSEYKHHVALLARMSFVMR